MNRKWLIGGLILVLTLFCSVFSFAFENYFLSYNELGQSKMDDTAGVLTQEHHWWPKELGGAKSGPTVSIQSANPNLHTAMGGIHPEMRVFIKSELGLAEDALWKTTKDVWFGLDFQTQSAILQKFYTTQNLIMPIMIGPGVVK